LYYAVSLQRHQTAGDPLDMLGIHAATAVGATEIGPDGTGNTSGSNAKEPLARERLNTEPDNGNFRSSSSKGILPERKPEQSSQFRILRPAEATERDDFDRKAVLAERRNQPDQRDDGSELPERKDPRRQP